MTTGLSLLAIDTATEACSVALNLRGVITRRLEVRPGGHSRLLPGMVEELLEQAGLGLEQLDALAVDTGPGSFTGLRIGIGVAQGLAYGAGRKVIAVNSLEALAAAGAPGETVLAAIDARMGQVYYGIYRPQPGTPPKEIVPPSLAAPGQVGHTAQVGVGSGFDAYADQLGPAVDRWLAKRYPDAAQVAQVAAARGMQSAVSPLRLAAAYIRNEVVQSAPRKDAPALTPRPESPR